MVPTVVPFATTEAPGIVDPSSAEVTIPVTSLVWAKMECMPTNSRNASNNGIFFIDNNLMLKIVINCKYIYLWKYLSTTFIVKKH
jgi:hypothetical protein